NPVAETLIPVQRDADRNARKYGQDVRDPRACAPAPCHAGKIAGPQSGALRFVTLMRRRPPPSKRNQGAARSQSNLTEGSQSPQRMRANCGASRGNVADGEAVRL